MEAKPLRTASIRGVQKKSDNDQVQSSKGVQVKKEEEEIESASSMKLIIGIDASDFHCHHDGPVVIKHEKPLLTAAQLHELKLQVAIYRYIAAGLPVPYALVLPIRKSVAASFPSFGFAANAGHYSLFPSCIVGYRSQEFDSRKLVVMDPVPDSDRCRRTDGKKWRCKRIVVTGQKYCERHMHRGRNRSRKLVESSQKVTDSKATPQNNSTHNSEISNIGSTLVTLPLNDDASDHINSANRNSTVDAKIISTALTAGVGSGLGSLGDDAITSTVNRDSIFTSTIETNESGRNNNRKTNIIYDRSGNCGNNVQNLINRGNKFINIINAGSATFQGLNFSPKSVLQVQSCSSASFCKSDAELDLGRCRRTDGKKWRCRRDVMPNEKYCKMHVHRGARKHREASQSPAHFNATLSISTTACGQRTPILPSKEDGTILDTSLHISVSANPIKDDMNDTTISSNSDTTISDIIVAPCEDEDFSS